MWACCGLSSEKWQAPSVAKRIRVLRDIQGRAEAFKMPVGMEELQWQWLSYSTWSIYTDLSCLSSAWKTPPVKWLLKNKSTPSAQHRLHPHWVLTLTPLPRLPFLTCAAPGGELKLHALREYYSPRKINHHLVHLHQSAEVLKQLGHPIGREALFLSVLHPNMPHTSYVTHGTTSALGPLLTMLWKTHYSFP